MANGPTGSPQHTRPIAALFDLDRTITTRGTYTPFILSVARHKPRAFARVPAIVHAAWCYRRGRITRSALKETMLKAVLSNALRAEVDIFARAFVETWLQRYIRPGARRTIATHRAAGDYLILITASFDFYASLFADALGFNTVIATQAAWDDQGRLTGAIEGENCYGASKLKALIHRFPDLKTRYETCVYSDHHTDLPLLEWADRAVAVNPDRKLASLAKAAGFEVRDWGRPGETS